MILEIPSWILDGTALFGIGLEILGFIILIKFLRTPTWTEHKKWLDGYLNIKKLKNFGKTLLSITVFKR